MSIVCRFQTDDILLYSEDNCDHVWSCAKLRQNLMLLGCQISGRGRGHLNFWPNFINLATENQHFQQPTVVWHPFSWEPQNISINLILPETRVIGLHVCRCKGLSSFKFSWWAPKTHGIWNEVRNGHSRSQKIVYFGTNRKRVWDFLTVINSIFATILSRFTDITGFLLRTATPPHFARILGVFPWTRLLTLELGGAKILW